MIEPRAPDMQVFYLWAIHSAPIFFKKRLSVIQLLHVCMYVCMRKSEDNMQESGLPFYHVDSRNWTWVVSLGGKCLWHVDLSKLDRKEGRKLIISFVSLSLSSPLLNPLCAGTQGGQELSDPPELQVFENLLTRAGNWTRLIEEHQALLTTSTAWLLTQSHYVV